MCFLKHIKNISQDPVYSSKHGKAEKSESDTENLSSQEMLSNFERKSHFPPVFDSSYFLMNCLGLMNFNSQILKNLDQVLLSIIPEITFDWGVPGRLFQLPAGVNPRKQPNRVQKEGLIYLEPSLKSWIKFAWGQQPTHPATLRPAALQIPLGIGPRVRWCPLQGEKLRHRC